MENQPWSGEANVHVSIVNWMKTRDPALVPKSKRLWSIVEAEGKGKSLDLNVRETPNISPSLSDKTDVSSAQVLSCNEHPQCVFQGVTPGHAGFVLSAADARELIAKDPDSRAVIFPYLIGREIVSGDGRPKRFLIDFDERTIIEAMGFEAAFDRVQKRVLPAIEKRAIQEDSEETARKQHLEKWWLLWRHRSDMKRAIMALKGRCLTGSRTQRWPFVFSFISKTVLPGDKMQLFAFDDDYSFGIIQGLPHMLWYQAKAARLKNEVDYNYSAESVFDTFPWPQSPSGAQVDAVAAAGRKIRQIRAEALRQNIRGGLRGLYNSLRIPGQNPLKAAHFELDSAVIAAFGFSAKRPILDQVLTLNQSLSIGIAHGNSLTPPGIPPAYARPDSLIASDFLPC